MNAFRCPRCGATFPEVGFCPHDGARLVEPGPQTIDDLTPTVASTQMQAAPPPSGFQSVPPSGMFRGPGADNTADAIAAFQANARGPSEYDRLIGQVLDGRYRIEGKLGEGGMGLVFAARHAVIERPLAIKVLKREVMRDQATIKRFVQEAKAASRIGHPNIIDVTDFGTTPEGLTYQVMEYVEGQTLGHAIKAGAPFKPSRSLRIAAQLARGLGAAHDKGIVHRDLKPENIFLTDRDGRRDFVKIVDFGIAKVAPVEGDVEGPRLTRAGAVFGTPEYMAPEQAAGRGDTDGRVDIYALGVILYEMTTGKVPFKGETMVRTLAMQMLDTPVPPSQLRPDLDLPPAFEDMILRALTKKKEQRYQTMGELLADLERIAGSSLAEPLSAAASLGPERAFTLAPLPPGADAARVRSARPSMPLLGQRSRRGSAPMPHSGSDSGSHAIPSRPGDSGAHPIPSTGDGARMSGRVSAQLGAEPSVPPAVALASVSDGKLRRIKNEPQFVSSMRPQVSLAHVVEHEHSAAAALPRRWPWIVLGALAAAGLGVMIAVTLRTPRTEERVPVVVSVPIDARAPDPVPPAPPDAAPAPDSRVVVALIPDGRPRDRGPRDARRDDLGTGSGGPTGPGPVGLPRGLVGAVRVVTQPEGGTVYTNDTYRGPSGIVIQEDPGVKKRVSCRMPGYLDGEAEVTWQGEQQTVVCKMVRKKQCIEGLRNPFDPCP